MADKKYVSTTVALNSAQHAKLDQAMNRMSRELHINLSRSEVIERLCGLYNAKELDHGKA
jgi:hypothetical protein